MTFHLPINVMPFTRRHQPQRGLTLIELVVVLTVLVALSAMVVPLVSGNAAAARDTGTRSTLGEVRDVIMNRYLVDVHDPQVIEITLGGQPVNVLAPPTIRSLFHKPEHLPSYNPTVRLGWNGPYLVETGAQYPATPTAIAQGFTADYGTPGGPAILDCWGNPIVIRPEIMIRENGPGNPIEEIPYWALVSAGRDGILATEGDNLVAYLAPIEIIEVVD